MATSAACDRSTIGCCVTRNNISGGKGLPRKVCDWRPAASSLERIFDLARKKGRKDDVSPRAHLRSACPIRVWNGIFAAGDWRAKRGLKAMSPRRDRKSETTTCEKWPQKRLFC